jgi:hypothetical protein
MKPSTETPNFLGIKPYFDQPFYVGFNVGGYELDLDPDPSSPIGAGGVIVYWGVSDADAALSPPPRHSTTSLALCGKVPSAACIVAQ